MGFEAAPAAPDRVRLAGMSSDITSTAPEKKALTPVVVWTKALDDALDRAETQWITPQQFARDDRFATLVPDESDPTGWKLSRRDRSALQHAVRFNLFGLQQSRRRTRVVVPTRGGHTRIATPYAYALWRIYKWLGIEDDRRPKPSPSTPQGPLKQSVQFTSPTPQDEEIRAPSLPRQRHIPDVMFIPPPASSELEVCCASG